MQPIYEAYKSCLTEAKDVTKKQYQDTAKGAAQAFKDLAMMNYELDPKIYDAEYKGQKAIADPKIAGVWMFKSKQNKGDAFVLYLKGYEDSYGDKRSENEIVPAGS